MAGELDLEGRRRIVTYIAYGCLAAVVISVAMIVVGDPFWNLYFIGLAWCVGIPLGLGSAWWLIRPGRSDPADG